MLTINEVNNWKEKGYIVVKNLLNNDKLNHSVKYLTEIYKSKELGIRDFGSDGKLEFPSNTILDYLSMDENMIKCVQQLLSCSEITLLQCDTWGKKGSDDFSEQSNNDQRMHMDYGNNTFLHPSDWYNPEAVAAIIYLSDVNKTEGGTAVVPRTDNTSKLYKFPYANMPGINNNIFINNKLDAEDYFYKSDKDIYNFRQELYKNEIIIKPNIGDILFYRLDIWHRGTPVNKDHVRFVTNLLWKKRQCYWINNWNPGWTKKMYYGQIEKLFVNLSPLQRSLLNIPLPGDKYWTVEKLELLKMRYPKIDTSPYLKFIK